MRGTAMYHYRFSRSKAAFIFPVFLVIAAVCFTLIGCALGITPGGSTIQCQGNCTVGSGVQGVQVFVEPDDGEQVITDAIRSAQKSIWLEIYILSDQIGRAS